MENTEDKDKIMTNLRNLKDQNEFKGISITDDYTLTERQIIKVYSDKAKEYNEEESQFKIHLARQGTPKNGLILKKILKQRPQTQVLQE